MIKLDLPAQPGFIPGTRYRRGPDGEPVVLTEGEAYPALCCGEEPAVTYGLGAPCGGFAVWACCMGDCGRWVWFVPSSEDE